MVLYEKPVVLLNEDLAEGVYAASGDVGGGGGANCYTVTAYIHQTPEIGRGDYRIQVNGTHAAADNHHSGEQHLFLSFSLPVEYVSSNGSLAGGDGTRTIEIKYNYHNNAYDNIGLGDVVVKADAGLAVTGAVLSCNYKCEQHDGL